MSEWVWCYLFDARKIQIFLLLILFVDTTILRGKKTRQRRLQHFTFLPKENMDGIKTPWSIQSVCIGIALYRDSMNDFDCKISNQIYNYTAKNLRLPSLNTVWDLSLDFLFIFQLSIIFFIINCLSVKNGFLQLCSTHFN